jgi:hypothetical protein
LASFSESQRFGNFSHEVSQNAVFREQSGFMTISRLVRSYRFDFLIVSIRQASHYFKRRYFSSTSVR